DCDPTAKPGVLAFRNLMLATYPGVGRSGGIVNTCDAEGMSSEHADGRAWDWMLDATDPQQRAVADHLLDWLFAKGPDGSWAWNARRFGVMYAIWNGRIWGAYSADQGWRPYKGSPAHTDHIHFSFSWDGALARTSAWTGVPVTTPDLGPCAPVIGQAAARYAGPTYSCPTPVPAAVQVAASAYARPRLGYGSTNANVPAMQRIVGVAVTGRYDLATEAAVKAWQQARGLYPSGVVDPATWTVMFALSTVPAATAPPLADLTAGAANPSVVALQSRLVALGWLAAGSASGSYDAATQAAVAAFQQAQGWSGSDADGLMGPGTLSRLFAAGAPSGPLASSGGTSPGGQPGTPATPTTPTGDKTPVPAPVPPPTPAPKPPTSSPGLPSRPAPATPPPTGAANLRPGMHGALVGQLQARLVALGWLPAASATGSYDAATRSAVAAFQRAQGWRGTGADGVVGPMTVARLWAAGAAHAPGKPPVTTPSAPRPSTPARPTLAALRWGAHNADVAALQARLVALHLLVPSARTGTYDAATRAAVAAFQRAQHWTGSAADGMVGPLTLARLFA
ncbi:MAG TPA: peptidoglycan-binding protein, partial [Motilibacteraceae bacterium]|nr:peptidoglycan-binding protein [Motilibacteraceae bacterium]